MSEAVGTVAALWRFPVKSMRGEALQADEIVHRGIPGDRAFTLIDDETGKIVRAVNFKRYPDLFKFKARYAAPPRSGQPLPELIIELPDGREVSGGDPQISQEISSHLNQAVHLVATGEADSGNPDSSGPYHDAYPVSVLSNSTLRTLAELQPESIFDARRFRMNVIVESHQEGFPENEWVGRKVAIGDDLRLEITQPDARCLMTTLPQEELPEDRGVLTALARHNRLRVGKKGTYPCAGVYARVLSSGSVATGDPVSVT